jgi:hypothetical protein
MKVVDRHFRRFVPVAMAIAAGACGTSKLPEPLVSQRLIESSAVVTAIDTPARRLSVTTDDGSRAEVMLDPTVKNIDRIRIGDRVVVSYYQGVAAEVRKSGETPRQTEQTGFEATSRAGEQPGASVGTQLRTTVTVVAVDREDNTITVRSPDGRTRTLNVVRAEGQQFIAGLRAGDQVDVSFTEAVAVGVRPAGP